MCWAMRLSCLCLLWNVRMFKLLKGARRQGGEGVLLISKMEQYRTQQARSHSPGASSNSNNHKKTNPHPKPAGKPNASTLSKQSWPKYKPTSTPANKSPTFCESTWRASTACTSKILQTRMTSLLTKSHFWQKRKTKRCGNKEGRAPRSRGKSLEIGNSMRKRGWLRVRRSGGRSIMRMGMRRVRGMGRLWRRKRTRSYWKTYWVWRIRKCCHWAKEAATKRSSWTNQNQHKQTLHSKRKPSSNQNKNSPSQNSSPLWWQAPSRNCKHSSQARARL